MIQVIDRALDILEFLAQRDSNGASLKEISEKFSLNQATCANIIKSLTIRKYVEHIGPKKGFRLGPMAKFLVGNFSNRAILVMAAKDIVEKLSTELNENCLVGVMHHDKRILVYSTAIDHDLSVKNQPERTIYETASGRLLLAFLSDVEQKAFIEKNGTAPPAVWKEGAGKEKLLNELKAIREKKILITHSASHVVGVAVPIWKVETVIAALSTYLPESRFTSTAKANIEKKIRVAAAEISQRLSKT